MCRHTLNIISKEIVASHLLSMTTFIKSIIVKRASRTVLKRRRLIKPKSCTDVEVGSADANNDSIVVVRII